MFFLKTVGKLKVIIKTVLSAKEKKTACEDSIVSTAKQQCSTTSQQENIH